MTPRELAVVLAGFTPTIKTANELPASAFAVILALGSGPLSVTEIQHLFEWPIATASKYVGMVKARGYAVDDVDPRDRRRRLVQLTARGVVYLRSGRKVEFGWLTPTAPTTRLRRRRNV